jgi:outer membrane murein-binding lipoprotein Lpp
MEIVTANDNGTVTVQELGTMKDRDGKDVEVVTRTYTTAPAELERQKKDLERQRDMFDKQVKDLQAKIDALDSTMKTAATAISAKPIKEEVK